MTEHAAALDAALAFHRAGRLDDADRIYRDRVAREPRDALAFALGGAVRLQRGMFADALEWLDRSLEIRADQADVLANRGATLLGLARAEEALATCERALRLEPAHVEAALNRGRALQALGRLEAALDAFQAVARDAPQLAGPHEHAGVVLQTLGRWAEALVAHDVAVALEPASARAHSLRGAALLGLGRAAEALAAFDAALGCDAECHDALHNRSVALLRLGRWQAAVEAQERALRVRPDDAGTWSNVGIALHELGAHAEALASLERALALEPRFPAAHYNRGRTLTELRRWEEAAEAFASTLALRPDHPHALGHLLHARMQTCDWRDFAELQAQVLAGAEAGRRVSAPMPLLPLASTAAQQWRCASVFGADEFGGGAAEPAPVRPRNGDARLRIAYLSADFRDHPVAHLLSDLVAEHDRERFEVVGIGCGPRSDDAIAARLRSAFDRHVEAGHASDEELAGAIRDLGIDIAIDLGGYTSRSRLGALRSRPAPLQLGWLGYTGTYSVPFIDYVVADRVVLPDEQRPWYGESVVRLPHCYQVNPRRGIAPVTPPRRELGLPDDAFVYCCFNAHYKLTPDVFAVWMGLLDALPHAVLWLSAAHPAAERNLRATAAGCGIAPERLVFAPRIDDRAAHLARYRAADVFLDTFHYGAHTTAGDALSAGLPVVTCLGGAFAGRVGASLLHALGLPDLVAKTPAEYASLAHALAADRETLREVRDVLAACIDAQPLFDVPRFARDFERALVALWERRAAGIPNADLDIVAAPEPA